MSNIRSTLNYDEFLVYGIDRKTVMWAYPMLAVNKDDKEESYDIQTKIPTNIVENEFN
jgi:hypothetical protein